MKLKILFFVFLLVCSSCALDKRDIISSNFDFADIQLKHAFVEMDSVYKSTDKLLANPRNIDPNGFLRMVASHDWTSGFFPGELWYMYEYTKDDFWKEKARKQTELLEQEKWNGSTHDMGFKMYCSYGNGYRLTQDSGYKDILLQSAYTLIRRYNPKVGCIRSWDHNRDKWQYPVIIDNMMNLEFLFFLAKTTGEKRLMNMADSHAQTTLRHHFRDDYSCYHVVSYDTLSGQPHFKGTHQGYADNSAWARGQAWALYGYTMMYRETGKTEYLEQARKVASYIKNHPNLPDDKIPYWDFDAPDIPAAPRDASAAAVMASGLIELSQLDKSKEGADWLELAEMQIRSLSSPEYLAEPETNGGFILKHSVGNYNKNSEVDVPLSYADYYYVEALLRLKKLQNEN